MSIEAMKMALSAAKVADLYIKEKITGLENRKMAQRFLEKSNAALRAAIEQEHEPVECMCGICKLGKREWQGLTDEEVSEILDREIGFNSCFGPETDFARAIEAKLKEKNT